MGDDFDFAMDDEEELFSTDNDDPRCARCDQPLENDEQELCPDCDAFAGEEGFGL